MTTNQLTIKLDIWIWNNDPTFFQKLRHLSHLIKRHFLVAVGGVEPPISGLWDQRSTTLNYTAMRNQLVAERRSRTYYHLVMSQVWFSVPLARKSTRTKPEHTALYGKGPELFRV